MTERPKLKQFYRELYELHCTFGGMKGNECNWRDLYEAANELCTKNGNSDFTCKLVSVVLEQLEHEAKKG